MRQPGGPLRARQAVAVAALVATLHGIAAAAVPDFAEVRAAHRPSDRVFTDRLGQPLQALRVDPLVRRGAWLPLAELSPALRQAIVLGEDQRFWQHAGVDWRALGAAAWTTAWNQRTRGASTVTMQLAGLLEPGLRRPAGGRSIGQKLRQLQAAGELEARWNKAQILEAYLNLVPLRGEVVGVAAAARQLFGKHPHGVDAQEAAVLAALVRAPNADAAAVQRRACELLAAMRERCEGLDMRLAQALQRGPVAAGDGIDALAPHFARYWQARGGGDTTTIDGRLQRLAISALRQQLAELRGRDVDDGAVVVLHNATGEVRAWVGSAGAGSAADVDLAQSRRQPGSTLKPFVYGLAFERGLIAPGSLLHDAPLHLLAGQEAYQPQNFDERWRGWVSAREALAASLNIPAVRVAALTGPEALFETLNRAGLRLRENAGFHGHALALGSAEVNLLDLTNAYRALANDGRYTPVANPAAPRSRPEPPPSGRTVLRPDVARLLGDILSDHAARAASFGFDNPLVTRQGAAVKTGTSKDMRDNWCIGFTADYTVGVWIGNADGRPMQGVSGVVGAAPVWRRLIEALPAAPSPAWARSGHAAAGSPGHAGAGRSPRATGDAFRITSIADGSVLAFDPEIPAGAQRLRLQGPAGTWLVDGQRIGHGRSVDWAVQPGRHVVEVRAASGQVLDRVRLEVRPGVRLRPPAATQPVSRRG